MSYKFRRGDFVTYLGSRYTWGPRAGRFRTLNPADGRGSGLLIPNETATTEVFPGPDASGVFDDRHADVFEVKFPALRLRLSTLMIATNQHIGVLDARLEEHPSWTGPLSTRLQQYGSNGALLLMLLRRASGLLRELSHRNPDRKQEAIDAIVRILEQMPDDVQRDFVGKTGKETNTAKPT